MIGSYLARIISNDCGIRGPRPLRREFCRTNAFRYDSLEPRQLLSANAVVEWNEILLNAIRAARLSPPMASRAMAIVHTSMYDAVNSIDGRFNAYHVMAPVHPKA
ncbi:MAG TPA: hypothetical protein PKD54_13985, partial [Pirellulaceae bacterium]|nr:hypothetical protein [Pirellulaceae bacterium]